MLRFCENNQNSLGRCETAFGALENMGQGVRVGMVLVELPLRLASNPSSPFVNLSNTSNCLTIHDVVDKGVDMALLTRFMRTLYREVVMEHSISFTVSRMLPSIPLIRSVWGL
ncbi:hypothetical protein ACH5RR_029625 [Cinchona calisaya]|uniref:Uncharacterized protein n=1 Tax=Cinchona calisaya TaxID=153742 RepID=A0ABD2YS67_9GENT